MSSLSICSTQTEISSLVKNWKKQSKYIAFIPTMGALHAGHLSLIHLALQKADKVIVSVFVNPLQFTPKEDFKHYPRPVKQDLDMLKKSGCHCAFIPEKTLIYPEDFSTKIHVQNISEDLEGQYRPHFFIGVATIVTKLFHLVKPDCAVFGEKDYQQLCIIKKLVADLNMDIDILAGKTIRDSDGLALSSRNTYLSKTERMHACQLSKILQKTAQSIEQGHAIQPVLLHAKKTVLRHGFSRLDYLDLRTEDDFRSPFSTPFKKKARLLVAAYLGKTRLIDNWPVILPES